MTSWSYNGDRCFILDIEIQWHRFTLAPSILWLRRASCHSDEFFYSFVWLQCHVPASWNDISCSWFYALPRSDNVFCVARGLTSKHIGVSAPSSCIGQNEHSWVLESLPLFTLNILRCMKNTFDSHCDFIISYMTLSPLGPLTPTVHRRFAWLNNPCVAAELFATSSRIKDKQTKTGDAASSKNNFAQCSSLTSRIPDWKFYIAFCACFFFYGMCPIRSTQTFEFNFPSKPIAWNAFFEMATENLRDERCTYLSRTATESPVFDNSAKISAFKGIRDRLSYALRRFKIHFHLRLHRIPTSRSIWLHSISPLPRIPNFRKDKKSISSSEWCMSAVYRIMHSFCPHFDAWQGLSWFHCLAHIVCTWEMKTQVDKLVSAKYKNKHSNLFCAAHGAHPSPCRSRYTFLGHLVVISSFNWRNLFSIVFMVRMCGEHLSSEVHNASLV